MNQVFNIDCVNGIAEKISDESIDMAVTSPPYDKIRKYKGFSFDFENLAKELLRVLKPGGVICWQVKD